MLTSVKSEKKGKEGYVYVSYGHPKYLKHTIASVSSLRRYDKERPIALVCNDKHRKILEEYSLSRLFDDTNQNVCNKVLRTGNHPCL